MGYVVFKGELFTERPILEKQLDYNLINLFSKYYTNQQKQSIYIDGSAFVANSIFSEDLENYKNVCIDKNLDQLLIISRNTDYLIHDPMLIYKNLNHELGIEVYKKTQTRALLYGNFRVYIYDLKNNQAKNIINKIYIVHRFKNNVFNKENYELINPEVEKTFITDLEKLLAKKLNKYYLKF